MEKIIHKGTRRMETERLILRMFGFNDTVPMYNNWASDEEVSRYLTWPAHSSVTDTEHIINLWCAEYNSIDIYNWAIVLKETMEPVGSISVVETDDDCGRAQIGYCLSRKYWGQGIVPEAVKKVTEYLFDEVGYNRIEAVHDTDNGKSGRVLLKCRFSYEGTLRKYASNNRGQAVDVCMYSILKDEK